MNCNKAPKDSRFISKNDQSKELFDVKKTGGQLDYVSDYENQLSIRLFGLSVKETQKAMLFHALKPCSQAPKRILYGKSLTAAPTQYDLIYHKMLLDAPGISDMRHPTTLVFWRDDALYLGLKDTPQGSSIYKCRLFPSKKVSTVGTFNTEIYALGTNGKTYLSVALDMNFSQYTINAFDPNNDRLINNIQYGTSYHLIAAASTQPLYHLVSQDGKYILLDERLKKPTPKKLCHDVEISSIALNKNELKVAVGCFEEKSNLHTIKVYDVRKSTELFFEYKNQHTGTLSALCFSSTKENQIISGDQGVDGTLNYWDVVTGETLFAKKINEPVYTIHPLGNHGFFTTGQNKISTWRLTPKNKLEQASTCQQYLDGDIRYSGVSTQGELSKICAISRDKEAMGLWTVKHPDKKKKSQDETPGLALQIR